MFNLLVGLGVGIFLGWVVIPQPAWAQALYDKIKGLFKRG